MISLKKKVPIALKKMLETIYEQHPTLIKPVDDPQTVVKLVDRNGGSDFFFAVLKCNTYGESKPVAYNVTVKPKSEYHQEGHVGEVTLDQVAKALKKWVSILLEYSKESALFDDPILKRYYEDLGIYFEIKDPDATTAPYGFARQQYLYRIFENIKTLTLASKNVQAKENEGYVSEIIQAFTECQDNLGRETKLQVVDRFKRGLAKIIKYNLPLAQAILEEINKPEAQQMINGDLKVYLHPGEHVHRL